MEKVFNLLRTEDLTNFQSIDKAIMDKWQLDEILDFNTKLTEEVPPITEVNTELTNFNFVVNSNLSANRTGNGCMDLKCRLAKIDRLSRFAALYSDRIYIPNYFDSYPNEPPPVLPPYYDVIIRRDFANDLKILIAIKPLLDRGIFNLIKHPTFHLCSSCIEKEFPSLSETRKQLNKEVEILSKTYVKQSTASVCKIGYLGPDTYCIRLKGPEDIIDHGQMYCVLAQQWVVDKYREHANEKEINITKTELKKSGIIKGQLDYFANDILLQNVCSKLLSAKYLTDRDVDIQLLDSLTYDSDFKSYNHVLRNKLLYELPILDNATLDFLLEVRENEPEAFLTYRNTISQIIKEYLSQRTHISDQDAQQIYEDIIYPRLCELNAKVKSIKSGALNTFKREITITATIAALGMYSGLLPIETKALVASLGGLTALKSAGELLWRSVTTPDEIRNDNFYYLWKVSRPPS